MSETRTYNADNTLSGIAFSGAAIGDLSYAWDANKNKTSEGVSGSMSGYGFDVGTNGYDDEDRLTSWNRDDNALDQAWNLSLVGDWDSFTENASVQPRTHGPTHELLTAAGQSTQHDAKGNQTLIPANLRSQASSLTLSWDFENKLLGADTDGDSIDDVNYQFDALGRRVARATSAGTTVYVQSGQQTIADYTLGALPASPTYTYYYASYIDKPVMRAGTGGLIYYHRNQQYSIIALTDGGGLVKERYAYDAYGDPTILDASLQVQTTSAENNRYMYTGREWDEELGLYHYRARMYSPETGRFCSRDPIGFEGSKWNLFEYVDSMPLIQVDPFGKDGSGAFGWNCYELRSDKSEDIEYWERVTVGVVVSVYCVAAAPSVCPALWRCCVRTVGGGAAAGGTTLTEGQSVIGWVHNGRIVVMSAPNTSHAALGTQAGVVVNGSAVEGAQAFTAIMSGGRLTVVGSQNFGGVMSISTAVVEIVRAAIH